MIGAMSEPNRICLNMIMKKMVNLERCLGAVADQIECRVIGDTGSVDGTPDFIRSFFAKRGVPGESCIFPFVNFELLRAGTCPHRRPSVWAVSTDRLARTAIRRAQTPREELDATRCRRQPAVRLSL